MKDVHRIVRFACEGTQGSRFIESRLYQLDESTTNITVDPKQFHSFLEDGKAFEVTMILQALSGLTDCRRCGHRNDESLREEDNWMRWFELLRCDHWLMFG
jgi:hypothetical protein